MKQLVSIQILRGVAAFSVLLFHALDPATYGTYADKLFSIGMAGVDMFFVLSGFIMWASTHHKSPNPIEFWKTRWIRVAPLYYFYTAIYCAIAYTNGSMSLKSEEVVKTLLFIPFLNSMNGQTLPLMGVGWTLNYEMLFYLLFGLTLCISSLRWRFLMMSAMLPGLICLRPFFDQNNPFIFRSTSPLLLEFLAGMCIAAALPYLNTRRRFGGLVAIIGIGLLVVLFPYYSAIPRTIRLGVPVSLILAGVVMLEPLLQTKPVGWLKSLGDASYSLYLTQCVVFMCMAEYASPSMRTMAYAPFWILVATFAAFASFRFIETPLLSFMRRTLQGASIKVVSGPSGA